MRGGHSEVAARTLARCAAPPPCRASTSWRASPGSTASSTSAWPRRRCSTGPDPPSTSVATAGLAAGWASRTATLIGRRIRAGPWLVHGPSSWLPAPTSPTRSRLDQPVSRRESLATHGPTTTTAAGRAEGDGPSAAGRRPPRRRLRRRQLRRGSRGRPPRRDRLVRQECQCAVVRRGQLVRARVRHHHRVAAGRLQRPPTGAGRAPDASMVPDGAIVAPGVIDANRCLAWVLQRPGAIPVALRPAVGDRLYGCDDCQEACPPTVHLGRRHRRPLDAEARPWVDVLDLLAADERRARSPRAVVHRRTRPAVAAAQRTRDPRQHRARRRTRGRRALARYAAGDDEVLAEHARGRRASPGLGRCGRGPAARQVCDAVKHLLVTNDFPPKIGGIQSLLWEWWRRLPRIVRRADEPVRRRGPVRHRPAVPDRADPRAGAAALTRGWCGGSTELARESVPTWWCSIRRSRSGSSGRRSSCPTTSCCTAPRSPSPAGCPAPSRRSVTSSPCPPRRVGGATRRARPSGRPGVRCR